MASGAVLRVEIPNGPLDFASQDYTQVHTLCTSLSAVVREKKEEGRVKEPRDMRTHSLAMKYSSSFTLALLYVMRRINALHLELRYGRVLGFGTQRAAPVTGI